jgi:hypothetical protein
MGLTPEADPFAAIGQSDFRITPTTHPRTIDRL